MIFNYKKYMEALQNLDNLPGITELESILKDATWDLQDEFGLQVEIFGIDDDRNIFANKYATDCEDEIVRVLFLKITDINKTFCKNYPKDDMDWLYGKKVINNFIDNDLVRLGLIREEDYIVFGGGTSVTFAFNKKALTKI